VSRRRFSLFVHLWQLPLNDPGRQVFYREVVVWKRLQHPNIVPFLGVPSKVPPFEIVCEWMENDRITVYSKKHPEADRVGLVSCSVSSVATSVEHMNVKSRSCGMWQTAFTTSTRAT